LNSDYAKCVCGLAFYFSGRLLNVSPTIDKCIVSGYTQRISEKTGQIEDNYIFSVIFDRSNFSTLNVKEINPVTAFKNFTSRIKINSSNYLENIHPFDIKDIA